MQSFFNGVGIFYSAGELQMEWDGNAGSIQLSNAEVCVLLRSLADLYESRHGGIRQHVDNIYVTAIAFMFCTTIVGLGFRGGTGSLCSLSSATCSFMPHFA